MSETPANPRNSAPRAYKSQKAMILEKILNIPPEDTRHPERCNEEQFERCYTKYMKQVRNNNDYIGRAAIWKFWRGEVFVWRSYFGMHSDVPFADLEPPLFASTAPQVPTAPAPAIAPEAAAPPKPATTSTPSSSKPVGNNSSKAAAANDIGAVIEETMRKIEEKEEGLKKLKQKLIEQKEEELRRLRQELEERN